MDNWRTYAMKGGWLRVKHGLIDPTEGLDWVETSWSPSGGNQRGKFFVDPSTDGWVVLRPDPAIVTAAFYRLAISGIAWPPAD